MAKSLRRSPECERVRTSAAGAVEATFSSLPFGDGASSTGTDADPSHFTGLDADANGNSHAIFRDYSPYTATWLRADPYIGSYDQTDPQSMNRYAYVGNSPLAFADYLGLIRCVTITIQGSEGAYIEMECWPDPPSAGPPGNLGLPPGTIFFPVGGGSSAGGGGTGGQGAIPAKSPAPKLPNCLAVGGRNLGNAFMNTVDPRPSPSTLLGAGTIGYVTKGATITGRAALAGFLAGFIFNLLEVNANELAHPTPCS